MKKSLVLAFAMFCGLQAFAGTATVTSTTPASNRSYVRDLLTIGKLCDILKNVNMGRESTLKCIAKGKGIIELVMKNRLGQLSIVANANDEMNLEYYGDPLYYYTNDLNQMISIRFSQVNTGVRRTNQGAFVDGYYDADVNMKNGRQYIRGGAFMQDFGSR